MRKRTKYITVIRENIPDSDDDKVTRKHTNLHQETVTNPLFCLKAEINKWLKVEDCDG